MILGQPKLFYVELKDQTLHIRIAGVDAPEVCWIFFGSFNSLFDFWFCYFYFYYFILILGSTFR